MGLTVWVNLPLHVYLSTVRVATKLPKKEVRTLKMVVRYVALDTIQQEEMC